MQIKLVEILLVEDNPGDVLLTQEALAECQLANKLIVVKDGVEAWAYLTDQSIPHPDLILMDLNMPRMDGRELLDKIKSTPKIKRIPVIVLTTSAATDDILKTYDLHANAYVTKPIDLEKFTEIVKSIDQFWFSIVMLPSDADN